MQLSECLEYLESFENEKLIDLLSQINLQTFIKEAKVLTWVYDDTLSSRQLSLVY